MKELILLIAFLLTTPFFGARAFAQNSQSTLIDSVGVTPSAAHTPKAVAPIVPSPLLSTLASLPEADTLIYINTKRILNEAIPRFVPATEVAKLRQQFTDLKHLVGLDPSQIDHLIVAVRFREPSKELNFVPPEFMFVASGDFSADALIEMARLVGGDALREEAYGQKTLTLFTIDPILKEAEKHDILKSFAEVAIGSLNGNTIAIGATSYVKAAVDAEQGQGRISPETLSSLMRDPNVLLSIVGLPWNSFAKSFGLLGVAGNPQSGACESHFGDFYAAVTMDQTHFKFRGALNADNPDTAKIIYTLVASLTQQALTSLTDKSVQSILTNLTTTAEAHEVVLQADLSQQALLKFINEQMKPKETEAKLKTPAKKPGKRRRAPARRSKG